MMDSPPPPAPPAVLEPAPSRALAVAIALVILLIAAGLRIPGLFTDFWGDEIWSWVIAGQLHSIKDVLLAGPAHIDNNHPLNTLWLYLIGQNQPIWLYRLPALLAGVGSVALGAKIMQRRGTAAAVIAGLLLAFSYPLIFYSSEARGYAFAVFFSLLTIDFLQRALAAKREIGAELLFGVSVILGFLSHLTFLHIYVGAVVWSMVRVRRLEPSTLLRVGRLARLHAIPLAGLIFLFRHFIQGMVIGGAAPTSARQVIVQTLSLSIGGGNAGMMAMLATIMAVGIFVGGVLYLIRERSDIWVFFLFAVVISPAMACIRDLFFSVRPQPLMFRYFLVCVCMGILSVVPLVNSLWRRSPAWRWTVAFCLSLYLIGNCLNVGSFFIQGRGQYGEALARIASQSPGGVLKISSDDPDRTGMLVSFYGPRVAPGRQITVNDSPHKWLILNRLEKTTPPSANFCNRTYNLKWMFTANDLSGWTWEIYGTDQIP